MLGEICPCSTFKCVGTISHSVTAWDNAKLIHPGSMSRYTTLSGILHGYSARPARSRQRFVVSHASLPLDYSTLTFYHLPFPHCLPPCSSSLPSFSSSVPPAAGLTTALTYRDKYTIAVPRYTAMATAPASCLAYMVSSESIPSCMSSSCDEPQQANSIRRHPPHVSTVKGNSMAPCLAAP